MKTAVKKIYNIDWKCTKKKGSASTDVYEFKTETGEHFTGIEVDLVDSNNIQNPESPGVDCDVGNLIVGKGGIRVRYKLHKKKIGRFEKRSDRGVPLLDIIEHCLRKEFVL